MTGPVSTPRAETVYLIFSRRIRVDRSDIMNTVSLSRSAYAIPYLILRSQIYRSDVVRRSPQKINPARTGPQSRFLGETEFNTVAVSSGPSVIATRSLIWRALGMFLVSESSILILRPRPSWAGGFSWFRFHSFLAGASCV